LELDGQFMADISPGSSHWSIPALSFRGREKGILFPVGVLGDISLFFQFNNLLFIDFRLLAGILLVLIGMWVIFKKTKTDQKA